MDWERVEALIRVTIDLAQQAASEGNPPFGAVLADQAGTILLHAYNTQLTGCDPTAHSEINLLRLAARQDSLPPLDDLCLFTNAAPCSMCLSACIKAGIRHYYYGALPEPHMDPWLPPEDVAARSTRDIVLYPGILADECRSQIAAARASAPPPD